LDGKLEWDFIMTSFNFKKKKEIMKHFKKKKEIMKHFKLFEAVKYDKYAEPNYEPTDAQDAGSYLEWMDANIEESDPKNYKKWMKDLNKFCDKWADGSDDQIVDCAVAAGFKNTMKFINTVATNYTFNYDE